MLKNLLKYEFRATGRTYGGLYLVWLLVALAMGISMRDEVWDNGSSQIWAYLMFAYFAIGVAIGVVCIVTIIQRFTKNLLGREGYLMHTLPVHPEQLVASKLISSMVWVICSGVVGILSVLLMLVGLGAFEDPKTVINGETITTGWGDVLKFSWKAIQSIGGEFWSELAWIIVLVLAGVAVLILCIYAACMIGHQFRNHSTIASILAFFLLQLIQGKLDAGGGIRVIVGSVAAMPMAYSASGNLWLVLLVTILIGAVYGLVLLGWGITGTFSPAAPTRSEQSDNAVPVETIQLEQLCICPGNTFSVRTSQPLSASRNGSVLSLRRQWQLFQRHSENDITITLPAAQFAQLEQAVNTTKRSDQK